MIQSLQPLLKNLGLSEKEAIIFETLLYFDHLKAVDIAEKTNIQRTTVYAVLKSLVKQGLVSTVSIYGVTEFQALDPKLLPSVIERKKQALDARLAEVQSILPQLSHIRADMDAMPRVSFFHGAEGVKQAYEDTLVQNKGKEIQVFSGPDVVFKELGEAYVEYYVKKRKRLRITSTQIAPRTPWGKYIQGRDKGVLRQTLLIPESFAFDTEMVMYDNKLGIFSFREGKLMAVLIEDETIANTMRSLFRYIATTVK